MPVPVAGRRLLLSLLSVFAALAALKGLDHFVVVRAVEGSGLVFPRRSTVVYHAGEFDFTASTNGLGFRGGPFSIARRPGVARVVAIGDSMTYGWGVDAGCTWPALLEDALDDRGMHVEVANLGEPGADPGTYAYIASSAIPALRPDLVIVGMHLGDDLEQLDRPFASPRVPPPPRAEATLLARTIMRWFPNMVKVFSVTDVTSVWRAQAQALVRSLTPAQRTKYDALDADVRQMLEDGKLNPYLVQLSLGRPAHYVMNRDLRSARTAALVAQMAGHLGRVRDIAAAVGATVAVVTVPAGIYVSRAARAGQARVGFLADDTLRDDNADEAVRLAAARAGVSFLSITDEFRRRDRPTLYFPLDGHLTCDGTRQLAGLLAPGVGSALARKPAPAS